MSKYTHKYIHIHIFTSGCRDAAPGSDHCPQWRSAAREIWSLGTGHESRSHEVTRSRCHDSSPLQLWRGIRQGWWRPLLGYSIETLSTHYLHTIYTLSTQYLHNIYSVSTHRGCSRRGGAPPRTGCRCPGRAGTTPRTGTLRSGRVKWRKLTGLLIIRNIKSDGSCSLDVWNLYKAIPICQITTAW